MVPSGEQAEIGCEERVVGDVVACEREYRGSVVGLEGKCEPGVDVDQEGRGVDWAQVGRCEDERKGHDQLGDVGVKRIDGVGGDALVMNVVDVSEEHWVVERAMHKVEEGIVEHELIHDVRHNGQVFSIRINQATVERPCAVELDEEREEGRDGAHLHWVERRDDFAPVGEVACSEEGTPHHKAGEDVSLKHFLFQLSTKCDILAL